MCEYHCLSEEIDFRMVQITGELGHTLMLPMRFESEEATRVEAAAMREVTKNRDPNCSSGRPNL